MKKFYNLQGKFLRVGFISTVLWLAARCSYYGAGEYTLHKLQAEFGVQRMSQFLRSYVANHRFGVATTRDFLNDLLSFSQDQLFVDRFISIARIQVQNPVEG